MKPAVLLLSVLLLAAAAAQQPHGHRNPTPSTDTAPAQMPRPPAASSAADPAQMKRDAVLLAALAQTIPDQIDQVNAGKLPRDLQDDLRKIEKLAHRLRSEIRQER